jgi:phosphoribosyl-AMP cyclohydrolase
VNVDAGQCHVGFQSCFYRKVKEENKLELVAKKVYDPKKAYKK